MSSSPTTRASLIVRLRNRGDRLAWDEFVLLYSPLIRRVARSRGLQDADACEVVQDVLISIIKAIPTYELNCQIGSFRRWLTTIARNKTLNRLTRQPIDVSKRSEHVELGELSVSQCIPLDTENEFDLQWKQQLFVQASQHVRAQVQPATWSAFWLTAVEDRSTEEVSKELGMSLGAVYVARSRVLAKIRDWVHLNSMKWEVEHDR